nr:MAG TPA: hypothetical protein [Caudoviricetes sp.]
MTPPEVGLVLRRGVYSLSEFMLSDFAVEVKSEDTNYSVSIVDVLSNVVSVPDCDIPTRCRNQDQSFLVCLLDDISAEPFGNPFDVRCRHSDCFEFIEPDVQFFFAGASHCASFLA